MSKRFVFIRKKAIVSYLALLLIPILLVCMAAYYRYIVSIERDVEIYLNQVSEQIITNIESYIREINKLTIMPLYDEGVMNILRKHNKQMHEVGKFIPSGEMSKLMMFMLSAGFDRPEVDEIVIYTMDGIAFSNLDRMYGYEYLTVPSTQERGEYLASLGIYLQSPHDKPVRESTAIINPATKSHPVYKQMSN